ncbi:MAG TPA: GNAT family N-acetyltransferase [Actinomycetota bacterium]
MHPIDLPDGYTARPSTADDLEATFRLVAAAEEHDDGAAEIARSDIAAEWERPDFDLEAMSITVWHDDELAASGDVFMGRAEVDVAPAHRDRGIGSALLPWTWAVARADGRDSVGQTVSDRRTDAAPLFTAHGYEAGHTAWALRIDLADEPPPAPALPDGLSFRDFRPGDDDRAVFEVIDVAFDEWDDRESHGFDNWAPAFLHRDEVLSELVPLVVDGDRIVGVALNYHYGVDDDVEGWTQQLAVDRAYRGRGLGRALLQESFRRFHGVGYRRAGLSTDSRTGALGLYEHVGMRVRSSFTRYTKQLTDD